MIKVGVVGGTGYTGVELLRLLAGHSQVELRVITSRSEAGLPVATMFPNLRGHVDLAFSVPDLPALKECDLVFFATPNGTAMTMVPELLAADVRVVDLAADFRIRDVDVWQHWYGMKHACPDLINKAVYGLPEVNREEIKEASLIANPGCYPTATQLGFLPLVEQGLVDCSSLIADVKSGVSGAGRGASVAGLLCETSESMKAYAIAGHRHQPEIVQGLSLATDQSVSLTFVPHLTPMLRGIQTTLYGTLNDTSVDLQTLFENRYAGEPFVDVMPAGSLPETRSVKGANTCRIAVHRPLDGSRVVILAVIDNLVKGAAGQAVQNMNIMFDLDERAGLNGIALLP
ncbi:MAG: N-acetyl-gamma-glutamyl-phosphate reductase [Gammaproteobacteria bacterium]|nr:N-acetyl-gamma-glutamyl-phosphate reductase [Gammaproteobacteria bacterium]